MIRKEIVIVFICFCGLIFIACDQVTSIKLNSTEKVLLLGQTDSLIVTLDGKGDFNKVSVKWTSSNSCVQVINGKIQGVSKGTSTITVKSGTETASCNITVKDDIVLNFDKNYFIYYGDLYQVNVSGQALLIMTGSTDTLGLYVDVPLSTRTLSSGSYSFMGYYVQDYTEIVPYTILPGYLDANKKQRLSWYYGQIDCPIVGGQMIVSQNSGIYTIQINVKDNNGNKIHGTSQGVLYYSNMSSASGMNSEKSNFFKITHKPIDFCTK